MTAHDVVFLFDVDNTFGGCECGAHRGAAGLRLADAAYHKTLKTEFRMARMDKRIS